MSDHDCTPPDWFIRRWHHRIWLCDCGREWTVVRADNWFSYGWAWQRVSEVRVA